MQRQRRHVRRQVRGIAGATRDEVDRSRDAPEIGLEPHRHLREGAPNAYVLNGVRPLPFVLSRDTAGGEHHGTGEHGAEQERERQTASEQRASRGHGRDASQFRGQPPNRGNSRQPPCHARERSRRGGHSGNRVAEV